MYVAPVYVDGTFKSSVPAPDFTRSTRPSLLLVIGTLTPITRLSPTLIWRGLLSPLPVLLAVREPPPVMPESIVARIPSVLRMTPLDISASGGIVVTPLKRSVLTSVSAAMVTSASMLTLSLDVHADGRLVV